MDKLVAMEAFVRVAEAQSFAEAARKWGRSKASVSKYVGQLEAHLGLPLFQRTTRSVVLTEAGSKYYYESSQALDLIESSETRIQDDHLAARGRLRITAPANLLSMGEVPIVVSFREKYPEIEVDVAVDNRLLNLLDDRIDVAVRVTRPKNSSLIARPLLAVEHTLVASPSYLQSEGVPTRPEELSSQKCILDSTYQFEPSWPFRVDGREFDVVVSGPVRVNDTFLCRDLALAHQGIALVARILVQRELAAGTLVEVLPGTVNYTPFVYAVTSQRSWLPARTKVFIEHLKEELPVAFGHSRS